jgi:HAMP domain-containing protein
MSVTLQTRLDEAETAYHQLALGQNIAEFRDQNGELVRYTPANRGALWSYILRLRSELGMANTSRPGRATF